jgi:hypothetical protein
MKNTKLMTIFSFIIIILVSSLIFRNENNLPIVEALYNDNNDGTFITQNLIMNSGDTLNVDKNAFDGLEKYYKNMEAFGTDESDTFDLFILEENSESVVIIENASVIATNSGFSIVAANLYKKGLDQNGKKVIFKASIRIAEIYVINRETMIPITTAEDLANMRNDLDGHYILKADIDLAEWGDWEPIGLHIPYNFGPGFSGMFVNPYGYKIINLTINSSKTITSSLVGLFGQLDYRAYIDGIILEDISIDVSDYDNTDIIASPCVGGITGFAQPKVIISNCVVDGTIIGGGERTGGIVGENNCGIISKCTFNGIIKAVNKNVLGIFSVGGIAGYNNHSYRINDGYEIIENIIDCKVFADIECSGIAGGIIGFTNFKGAVKNSSFSGTLVGIHRGTMIGMEASGSEKPIDFD